MEQKKHSIQISDKLYNDIKSYCDANQLKVSEYTEKLLRREFTVDCYGPIPSIFVKDEEVDKTMGDIIENVGGPEAYSKLIDECMQEEPVLGNIVAATGGTDELVCDYRWEEIPTEGINQQVTEKVVNSQKVVEVPGLINEPKTEPINEVINETPVVNKPKKKVTKLK